MWCNVLAFLIGIPGFVLGMAVVYLFFSALAWIIDRILEVEILEAIGTVLLTLAGCGFLVAAVFVIGKAIVYALGWCQ